jgi:hypothetical protein
MSMNAAPSCALLELLADTATTARVTAASPQLQPPGALAFMDVSLSHISLRMDLSVSLSTVPSLPVVATAAAAAGALSAALAAGAAERGAGSSADAADDDDAEDLELAAAALAGAGAGASAAASSCKRWVERGGRRRKQRRRRERADARRAGRGWCTGSAARVPWGKLTSSVGRSSQYATRPTATAAPAPMAIADAFTILDVWCRRSGPVRRVGARFLASTRCPR